jgi:hypothetical protein
MRWMRFPLWVTSDKTHIEHNESAVTLIADMLTTKVALLRISNCRSGFLGAIDALPEDLADKAHKQTICSTSIRVV